MEDSPNEQIPNKVQELRRAAGLSQQTLATKAGLSTRTLARIEDGEDTKISTLAAIAAVLGVPVGDLLTAAAA